MERKFKVGDRVWDEDFGKGTVKFDDESPSYPYAVEFDEFLDGSASHCKDGHGIWLKETDLILITELEKPKQ